VRIDVSPAKLTADESTGAFISWLHRTSAHC
jgi:hypothetical protein